MQYMSYTSRLPLHKMSDPASATASGQPNKEHAGNELQLPNGVCHSAAPRHLLPRDPSTWAPARQLTRSKERDSGELGLLYRGLKLSGRATGLVAAVMMDGGAGARMGAEAPGLAAPAACLGSSSSACWSASLLPVSVL